jgi:hypothetical protein
LRLFVFDDHIGAEALFSVATPLDAGEDIVVHDEAALFARDLPVDRKQLDICTALRARLDLK